MFLKVSSSRQAGLKIYGDESHFPSYAQRLIKLGGNSPNIFFKGTFPPEKLGEILAGIDVLVVPSIWYENNPLVIQSAFAAGVPVVASDVPGISHLVKDQVNGILFPRGDEKALRSCLERFLQEPDLLPRLRRKLPLPKSIIKNCTELESIYKNLLELKLK